MAEEVTVQRGGIMVIRISTGNLIIALRGNGTCHVERADIADLIAALSEIQRTDDDGLASVATKEITGRMPRLNADGTEIDTNPGEDGA